MHCIASGVKFVGVHIGGATHKIVRKYEPSNDTFQKFPGYTIISSNDAGFSDATFFIFKTMDSIQLCVLFDREKYRFSEAWLDKRYSYSA